jgi:hypothetical protein
MENVQGGWKSSTTYLLSNAWEMPLELDDGRRENALWKKSFWEE